LSDDTNQTSWIKWVFNIFCPLKKQSVKGRLKKLLGPFVDRFNL
jgi:hypothetical protein